MAAATEPDTEPHTDDTPADPRAGAPEPTGGAWWRLGLTATALIAAGVVVSPALVVVILGVIALVAAHEFGHLLAARHAGVLATEYSIGMGPLIYSRRIGEVAWSLRALPVGAYVRVIGMSAADRLPADLEPVTYRQAPLRHRLLIAAGGPMANFALAFVLMVAAMMSFGRVLPENWTVDTAAARSAAAAAGIAEGDRVVAVDGVAVTTFDEMGEQVAARPGEQVTLTVADSSDGSEREVVTTLGARLFVYGTVGEDLVLVDDGDGVTIGDNGVDDGVLAAAGTQPGDPVTAVNGTDVATLQDAAEAFGTAGTVTLTIDGQPTKIELGAATRVDGPTGVLGISMTNDPQRYGPLQAVPAAADQLIEVGAASVVALGKFFWPPNLLGFVTGAWWPADATDGTTPTPAGPADVDPNRVLSIVGAIGLGADLAAVSVGALLWFFALMNLFIGLFNLVPFPPLDGGHIVVALYERARELAAGDGRRHLTDPRALNRIAAFGISVLLLVGVSAIWLDVTAPVF